MLSMQKSGFKQLMLSGGLLVTALLLWFAVANYLSAGPVAHSILRGLSLSLGQAIEALALGDPSLKSLSDFKSVDVAYFAIIDKEGRIRFHSNSDLVGNNTEDSRYLSVVRSPMVTEERLRLGTGEFVFETQQQLHLSAGTMVLRMALHTWQSDQIIRRAKTGVLVIVLLVVTAWGIGGFAMRLQYRDIRRLEEMSRREHLAQLGELGAIMAHEVRTPLSGIKGFAQLLAERLDDPRQQKYAGKIVAESERLEGLVDDLLTYVRQEVMPEGAATVKDVLSSVWENLAISADLSAIELQVIGEIPAPVSCPAPRLQQLLLNILGNSIQAMPHGGKLRVELSSISHNAVILVSDTGPGFEDKDLARVFDPFYTTRASGSGLGLAVCRKIAEGYGGRITAANGRSGGAEILLQLPLAEES